MPKSVITKWREVNRSINQTIKSSSSESEHDIMNIEHMHEEENYLNDSFTNIENSTVTSAQQKPTTILTRVVLKTSTFFKAVIGYLGNKQQLYKNVCY